LHFECWHVIVFAKNCFDWLVPPESKFDIGSGVGCNSCNFPFPAAQHIPSVSFLNFKENLKFKALHV